jgi:hypothetical protein
MNQCVVSPAPHGSQRSVVGGPSGDLGFQFDQEGADVPFQRGLVVTRQVRGFLQELCGRVEQLMLVGQPIFKLCDWARIFTLRYTAGSQVYVPACAVAGAVFIESV